MDSCIILNKGESLTFNYQEYFDLILGWSGYDGNRYIDDIDLCMFYKTKENTTGGIYSSFYGKRESEGSLSVPPFVFHMGEERMNPKYNDEEILRVKHLNEFEEVYVVAIDYFAATNNEDLGFTLPITFETLKTTPILTMTSQRTAGEKGSICILATLKQNKDGTILMNNESKYISLSEGCNLIPGSNEICY